MLRKEQIAQRRDKAETDNIWKEWLEEQIIKTLKAYGGRRELWPCDPTSRHVIYADVTGVAALGEARQGAILPPAIQPLIPADFEPPQPEPAGEPKE